MEGGVSFPRKWICQWSAYILFCLHPQPYSYFLMLFNSFLHSKWLVIQQELQKHGSPDIVMALVGNKADLHENREVPAQVSVIHTICQNASAFLKH